MFRKLTAVLAVSAALASPTVWSLGLGEINNDSNLNQPLKAQIKLLSSKDFSEDDLKARVASFEAYAKFGIERGASHGQISFNTVTLADGSKAIEVTTNSAIREPYLNFLVELKWPQGRLLREYTLLMDPPVFNKTIAPVTNPAPKPAAKPPVNFTPTTTDPQQKEDAREVTIPQEKEQPEAVERNETTSTTSSQDTTNSRRAAPNFNDSNWSVQRGDTLWAIAQRVKPEGVSVQQTLVSIYRNNPRAFINNDIDRLKAGVSLSVPEYAEIEQVSKNISVADLQRSTSSDSAPLDVRKTVEETSTNQTQSRGGRLTIASVDKNSLEANGSSSDAENSAELQNEIDTLREAVETLKLQNEQLQEELVSKDVDDSGVAVADDTLAVLTGSAEAAEDAIEVLDTTSVDSADAIEASYEETALAETGSGKETSESAVIEDAADVATTDASNIQETAASPAVNVAESEKSFWQQDNFFIWLAAAIAGLLAVIGGFFFIRKVRSDSEEELDSGFSERGFQQDEPRQSFLDKSDMELPEEETDPVIEAEILIARGKLSQAESLLESSLQKDSGNDMVRVKLLEIYASQQKVKEFNQLKQTLPEGFDHDSELGLKVASLVGLLGVAEDSSSDNLFGSTDLEMPSEEDIFGDDDSSQAQKNVVEIDVSEELETESNDLDFDAVMDDESTTEDSAKEATISSDNSIEFSSSLSDFDASIESTQSSTLEELVDDSDGDMSNEIADSGNGIDFSLESSDTAEQEALNEASSDSQAGLSDDEAETKLELARAYLEMGDDEAAKDILSEVTKEGNNNQSNEAQSLLDSM